MNDQALYQWINVTNTAPFAARDGAGAVVFQDRMWLLGGWNPGDKIHFPCICNNEVWSSRNGLDWTLVKPNTCVTRPFERNDDWEARHTAGYVVHDGNMWIIGGDANQQHYQPDVWKSSDGRTWTCVNRNAPWAPRVLQHAVAFKDHIWVMGGQTLPQSSPAPSRFYRDIWTTTDGVNWQQIEPAEPYWSARGMICGGAVFKDRIWILGGGTYDTPDRRERDFYNDVWSSADGIYWEKHVEHAPWAPRQYHSVAVFDDKLWVMKGSHSGTNRNNDVWYSADGVTWHELKDTPWSPRHAASVFVYDDALWMIAGNNMQPDVWKMVRSGDRR